MSPTSSVSPTHSRSHTATNKVSVTKSPSTSHTAAKTFSPSHTAAKSLSVSSSAEPSNSVSETASESASISETVTASITMSHSSSLTASHSAAASLSKSLTSSASKSTSHSETISFSATHTLTPSPSPTIHSSAPAICASGLPLYAWSAGMYNVCSQVNNYYQIEAFITELLTEQQALSITHYFQLDAINSGVPFDKAKFVNSYLCEQALIAGADVPTALNVTNIGQLYGVELNIEALNNHKYFTDEQIQQITNSAQVIAYQHTNLIFEQALLFTKTTQVNTYKNGYSLEDSLMIVTDFQFDALSTGITAAQAAQFTNDFQVQALLAYVPFDQAILFYNDFQVEALLLCNNIPEALTINSQELFDNYSC